MSYKFFSYGEQLKALKAAVSVPDIASGGAGDYQHFADLFQATKIDGALAASVFHSGKIRIPDLKAFLRAQSIEVRV